MPSAKNEKRAMSDGVIINNPRAHRDEWARQHPASMIEHGGILSREDLARWACDTCMAPLNPEQPIPALGGPEGQSLCPACAMQHHTETWPECSCAGCQSQVERA